jgi:hypothetical protein
MRTRGIDIGTLNDDEYIAAVNVDDYVVGPLLSAASEVENVMMFTAEIPVDNAVQREYIKSQAESLISNLKEILEALEG